MADEPTNGELARGLDRIAGLITGLVGRPEYASDQRAIEHRFTENERDIADLGERLEKGFEVIHHRISEQARNGVEHRHHWQQLIYTGVIPAIVAAAAVIAEYLIKGGGH